MSQAPSQIIPGKLFDHMERQQTGTLTAHRDKDGSWLVGYHFGEEDDDPDTYAGTASGTGETFHEAFAAMLVDLGL